MAEVKCGYLFYLWLLPGNLVALPVLSGIVSSSDEAVTRVGGVVAAAVIVGFSAMAAVDVARSWKLGNRFRYLADSNGLTLGVSGTTIPWSEVSSIGECSNPYGVGGWYTPFDIQFSDTGANDRDRYVVKYVPRRQTYQQTRELLVQLSISR